MNDDKPKSKLEIGLIKGIPEAVTEANKPKVWREWWIHVTNNNYSIADTQPPDYQPDDKNYGCDVHVIEHAALMEAEAEIAQWKSIVIEKNEWISELEIKNEKLRNVLFGNTLTEQNND